MVTLYNSKYRAAWLAGGLLILGMSVNVGCDRSDRAAVAESSSEQDDSQNVSQKSKKGMYSARIEQDSIRVGEPVEIAMVIEPGRDLKINLDFPWKIEMQEIDGVSFSASSFSGADIALSEERASVPLVVNVARAGDHVVEAIADFSVCNDDRCEILRGERVLVKVHGVDEGLE